MNIQKVEIKKIRLGENVRVRSYEKDGKMYELMDSIKQQGLLQPVALMGNDDSGYSVLFGNRRIIAHMKLGMNFIDARVFDDLNDRDFMTINLIENIQREDVSVTEQGRIVLELIDSGLSISEISTRISKPTSYVKRLINIYKVPKEYREKIINFGAGKPLKRGHIPATTADKIIQIDRQYRLGKANLDLLFQKAESDDNFGAYHLGRIMALLKEGVDINEAIQMSDNVEVIRINFVTYKDVVKRLCKKYNVPKHRLLSDIIKGKIQEKIPSLKNENKKYKKIEEEK